MKICSRCHKETSDKKLYKVDEAWLCADCLYPDTEPVMIYPIGVVKNGLRRARTGFGTAGDKQGVSCIKLWESQHDFMYKLQEETHLTVVYYLHESDHVKSVFCRGLDGKKVGVFASRTPYRLNRIAVQDVRLVRVEGLALHVKGLDAINGSPVLDIKMRWRREP
jgi:tRNA (Thr-GGU) A37 N-methylase